MIPLLRNTCPLLLRSTILRIPTTSIYVQNSLNQNSFFRPRTAYDIVPKSFHPYIHLSRIDKPTGFWVIFLPSAWSIAFAGTTLDNFLLTGLFGLGAILMRGAGCTINDIWDKDYDRRVERTKSRPIASGKITIRQGIIWAGIQLSLSFLIIIQLNLPTIIIGSFSLIPVIIYPIMKRYTYWPQIFLGITLNWLVNYFY
jgi:4-hydroxybenzoate polyprenyltransferase